MSLKEKILENKKEARCINCINFEMLDSKIPYCSKTDKLIIDTHIDIVRKCNNFQLGG